MKITILGSGTYQPQLDISTSCYLVQIGNENLVFDFGRGSVNQLLRAGVEYYDIDAIFITHTHADHCNDLSGFLHIALAEPINGKFRKKDISIYGPIGIKRSIEYLLEAFDLQDKNPEFKIKIEELDFNGSVKTDKWFVRSYKAKHSS